MLDARQLMAAGAAAATDLSERVAQALQPYFAEDAFPGVSVTVVEDGQVALAQGYGVNNVSNGAPVEADTRFDIGSLTKTFTALGVLLLYQESQGTSHPMDLNAPISDYLHNTRSFRLPPRWSHITTMELLDMSSGLPDVGGPAPWPAELASVAGRPLLYTPGTETSYSSANYDLLGDMIQQWTGESYRTFIQRQILDPLGMSQTEVLAGSAKVANQAVGYDAPKRGNWQRAVMQNGTAMFAAAGMVSTAQDMGTYMTAMLAGRLLTPANYALMWTSTPTPQYGDSSGTDAEYGLGWDSAIDTDSGTRKVVKAGQVPGFTSELILSPVGDRGVFVSFNSNYYGSRDPNGVTALQVAQSVFQATKTD